MRTFRKSPAFLAAIGLVSLLAISACSKSDQSQTPPPRSDVSQLPPPQGNQPAAPAAGAPGDTGRSGGY
jgi:hypothetical protein